MATKHIKLNKVKERMLFFSPTVQAGWEDESEIGDFQLSKLLGKGAFGRVSKAIHKKSQLIYAIKEINKQNLKENNMVEQVTNEVKIMYTLNHPNIVKLYNHFEDDSNIYLIQEFATGGQMYQLMWKQPGRRFQEKKVAQYIYQLTLALQKCHQFGIIHRDIKPENLLVDGKGNLKLADFGWSNFLKPNANDVRDTFCGTLDYLAPEMLEPGHKHDFNVDIWAIGVLTFELSTGTSPFAPRDQQFNANYVDLMTRKNIKNLTYTFPSSFPLLCKDMVQKILVKEPKSRLQLNDIIGHPWIQEHCQDYLQSEKEVIEKKEIIKVTEIEDFVNQGKAIFTQDEIYNYSRPDSIINKEFSQSNTQKSNYQQPLSTIQSANTSITSTTSTQQGGDQDMKQQIIVQLQQKIQDIEKKNQQLGLENSKKNKQIEQLKNELQAWQSGGGGETGQPQSALQNELQIEKEKYNNLKNENAFHWGKLRETEDKVKELQAQVQLLSQGSGNQQEIVQQMLKYKQLYEQSSLQVQKLQNQQQQTEGEMFSDKKPNQPSNNIDQLLNQVKQETKSGQVNTKQNKYF